MDSKDSDILCPRQVNVCNKNTPSMHSPRRQNVTTSVAGLKTDTHAKIPPKLVNPRYIAGNAEKEEDESDVFILHDMVLIVMMA